MTKDRDQFNKVLTLAINPGSIEGEAVAALRRLRELVAKNPTLAHPTSHLPQVARAPPPEPNATLNVRVTGVHPDWLLIGVSLLSRTAFELTLKYRIDFDFSEIPTVLTLVCEGTDQACSAMSDDVTWLINYINKQTSKSS
jgi:hypothetical protein